MIGRRTLDQSNQLMSNTENDMGTVYDALRCDLIHLLVEHRSQGRFALAAAGTDQERSIFLADLTRSIADILIAAYPKRDTNACATALADARTIASSILDSGLLTSR
jgi:hypothetical protein